MSINKILLSFGFLLLFITPFYAYHTELYQWSDLNKTSPYLNEFMICYLRNDTNIIWDTYNGGIAQFFTPNVSLDYDLYCCDNCRIDNNISIHLSPNSLHYNVDTDITISENTILEYAINDIIEDYRTIAVTNSLPSSSISIFDDFSYGDLIPLDWLFVIIITLSIPLSAWLLTNNINLTMLFFGLGMIVGSFISYFWELIGLIPFIFVELILFGIMWFIGKMIR